MLQTVQVQRLSSPSKLLPCGRLSPSFVSTSAILRPAVLTRLVWLLRSSVVQPIPIALPTRSMISLKSCDALHISHSIAFHSTIGLEASSQQEQMLLSDFVSTPSTVRLRLNCIIHVLQVPVLEFLLQTFHPPIPSRQISMVSISTVIVKVVQMFSRARSYIL